MGGGGGHHGHDDHGDHHDDHHHGPLLPPFGRLPPPNGQIPLETELVWDDTVAPETAIDFDASHVPTSEVLLHFAMGFGFFGLLYFLVSLTEPEKNAPVAPRSAVINQADMWRDLGLEPPAGSEEEHEDEE
eukprot:gene1320-1397_t